MRTDEIKMKNELMAVDDAVVIGEMDFFFLYSLDEKEPLSSRDHNRLIEIHERVFPEGPQQTRRSNDRRPNL